MHAAHEPCLFAGDGARRHQQSGADMAAVRSSGGLRRVGVVSRLVLVVVAASLCRGSQASAFASDMSAGPAAYMHWPVPRPPSDGHGAGAQPGLSSQKKVQDVLKATGKNMASVYKSAESFVQGAAGGAIGTLQDHPWRHLITTSTRYRIAPPLLPPPPL